MRHPQHPNNTTDCDLYLAPSSIPNSGWGMYTSIPLSQNSIIQPVDLTIQVHDTGRHRKTQNRLNGQAQKRVPTWVMRQYYWDASVTHSTNEARSGSSIIPSYGMLANSHPGLVNLDNEGVLVQTWENMDRFNDPAVGSFTQWKNQSFIVNKDLPAGHELFADYGDGWFRQRTDMFGKIPLQKDYIKADRILKKFETLCDLKPTNTAEPAPSYCNGLWNTLYDMVSKYDIEQERELKDEDDDTTAEDDDNDDDTNVEINNSRLGNALPKTLKGAIQILHSDYGGTAFHLQPNVIRPPEWFQKEGLCLDHMEPLELKLTNSGQQQQHGAFAKRKLPKNTVVAPAPLVHMHKNHLQVLLMDANHVKKKSSNDNVVFWKGHQLLMNYCYGHVSSSILLFPYSPVTNFINHYNNDNHNERRRPNVGLRWSSYMSSPEWLSLTTDELLSQHDDHAGLMMEFVALRDIEQGDEIVLDYGDAWQNAWDRHVAEYEQKVAKDTSTTMNHPEEDYHEAAEYKAISWDRALPTYHELPSNVKTLCWLDMKEGTGIEVVDRKKRLYRFKQNKAKKRDSHFDAMECYIQDSFLTNYNNTYNDPEYTYTVVTSITQKKTRKTITNVPRDALDIIDREYSRHQHLRRAFRHEIQLPEEMVPVGWRDLDDEQQQKPYNKHTNNNNDCGLYLAPSLIPNSGLGMFTAKTIPPASRVYNGDVVIQVEDVQVNKRLRHWYHNNNTNDDDEPEWHLHDYYWQSSATMGEFDADSVHSIVPGLGMLANSHPGLVNVVMQPPVREDGNGIHRSLHPEAGSSSQYHDVHYKSLHNTIDAGSELFVEYGDAWFSGRTESFGLLPLSNDFDESQSWLVEYYEETIGKNWENNHSESQWKEYLQSSFQTREEGMRKDRQEQMEKEEAKNDTDEENDDEDDELEDTLKEDEEFETWLEDTKTRLKNALPSSWEDVQSYLEHGTASSSVPQNAVQSLDYLKENGICLDHIQPTVGVSTNIPRAHKGAVVVREIPEGETVSAAPVVPIRRHHLEIWDAKHYHSKQKAGTPWFLNSQQLLNYCYGHANSSLLLFPYSPVVNYINHHPTQANVELQWSSRYNKEELLRMTPDELMLKSSSSGLVLEIVATRDLQPGEEVFLNYGNDYETAWQNFQRQWKAPEGSEHYVSSIQLNTKDNAWLTPIRTVYEEAEEASGSTYPPNVMTVCTVPNLDGDLNKHPKVTVVTNDNKGKKNDNNKKKKRYQAKWFYETNMYSTLDRAHVCQVLSRYGGSVLDSVQPELQVYTVAIIDDETETEMVFTNVPRRAIQFYDAPYTTDATALRGTNATFRKEIGLPTNLVPEVWMDLV